MTHSLLILTDSYINLYNILDVLLGIVHLRTQKRMISHTSEQQANCNQKLQQQPQLKRPENTTEQTNCCNEKQVINRHKKQSTKEKAHNGSIHLFGAECTFKFCRLPLLGSFMNELFLAALLMSAAIEGIQTCFHESHLKGSEISRIMERDPLLLPGFLVGFAIVGTMMQWCSRQAHKLREHELQEYREKVAMNKQQGSIKHRMSKSICSNRISDMKCNEQEVIDEASRMGPIDCIEAGDSLRELNVGQLKSEDSSQKEFDDKNVKLIGSDPNDLTTTDYSSLDTSNQNSASGRSSNDNHRSSSASSYVTRMLPNKLIGIGKKRNFSLQRAHQDSSSLSQIPYDSSNKSFGSDSKIGNISLKSMKMETIKPNGDISSQLFVGIPDITSKDRNANELHETCLHRCRDNNKRNEHLEKGSDNGNDLNKRSQQPKRKCNKNERIGSNKQLGRSRDDINRKLRTTLRVLVSPISLLICAALIYFVHVELVTEISDAILAVSIVIISYMTLYTPLKTAGLVLLQSMPYEIDLEACEQDIKAFSNYIVGVTDLRIWSVTANSKVVATCQLRLMKEINQENMELLPQIIANTNVILHKYGIGCSTIEPVFV